MTAGGIYIIQNFLTFSIQPSTLTFKTTGNGWGERLSMKLGRRRRRRRGGEYKTMVYIIINNADMQIYRWVVRYCQISPDWLSREKHFSQTQSSRAQDTNWTFRSLPVKQFVHLSWINIFLTGMKHTNKLQIKIYKNFTTCLCFATHILFLKHNKCQIKIPQNCNLYFIPEMSFIWF